MELDGHLLGCVAQGKCPSPTAHRRLAEAHLFWHRCLDEYFDPDAFRAHLNACIQALRNVTFAIQKEMAHAEGFKEWYAPWRTAMGRSDIMQWAIRSRNRIVKEGDLITESSVVARLVTNYYDVASSVRRDLMDPAVGSVNLAPPMQATLNEIKESAMAQGASEADLADSVVLVERRWVDSALPATEILNALAYVFSFVSTVLLDADVQFTATRPDPELDPETCGLSEKPYPGRLRPSCMVTTLEARSFQFRPTDGDPDVGGKSWAVGSYDPELSEIAAGRYGRFGPRVAPINPRSALDYVDSYVRSAIAVLQSGDDHGWFIFFFRGGDKVHTEILMARDKADKYVLSHRMAELAARLACDGVIEMGEVWLRAPQHDPAGAMVGADSSVKPDEALVVGAELASGEKLIKMIPFERTWYGAVTVGEPAKFDAHSNFLGPIREYWASRPGRGDGGTVPAREQQ